MLIFRQITCPSCRSVVHAIGLLLLYFGFLILAGYIFVVIEEDEDVRAKDRKRKAFLDVLAKYNFTKNDSMVHDIVIAAYDAFDVNALDLSDFTNDVDSEWHIGSAVFFTGTIVTTIGYGNIAPSTMWGKLFCIFIALVGIPFTGVILGKMGVGLTNLISKADDFVEDRIKQCFSLKGENAKVTIRRLQLAFVLSLFCILFLLIPAAAFIEVEENWEYFDSFYFCFISLTTIGLGDITPGASSNQIKLKEGINASLLKASAIQASVMIYLLTGLAALSIILALVGSIIKSAAEKTLDIGGKAFIDVGGMELISETKRLASSIRKKTVTTLGLSNSQSTINEEPGKNITMVSRISEHEHEDAYVITEKGEIIEADKTSANNNDLKNSKEGTSSIVMVNENTADADTDKQSLLGSRVTLKNSATNIQDTDKKVHQSEEVVFSEDNEMQKKMPTAEG
ncbi:potassium channel subfamily K member 16-like [Rhopilema esculentum]|uniref:potassium channel subfamily K member 16-like n=1 Tax=Rhopilema esculentum TaxID=499914 RepID=UPI0031D09827|eukprot:gene2564-757_t